MRAKIGDAAKLSVSEGDKPPHFVPYVPFSMAGSIAAE